MLNPLLGNSAAKYEIENKMLIENNSNKAQKMHKTYSPIKY